MKSANCITQNEERSRAEELSERLLAFAVRVGKVVNALPATRLGRHIAAQLIRAGTSAAPNYEEGCAAESRADFVHKLGHRQEERTQTQPLGPSTAFILQFAICIIQFALFPPFPRFPRT